MGIDESGVVFLDIPGSAWAVLGLPGPSWAFLGLPGARVELLAVLRWGELGLI